MRSCDVEGCARPHFGKGYCNTHYYRLRRTGSIDIRPRETAKTTPAKCDLDDCDRPAKRRAADRHVCSMHATRYARSQSFERSRAWSPAKKQKDRCAVSDCESPEDGNRGLCKMHDTRVRRHGDPNRVVEPGERRTPSRENHPHWTGEKATYQGVHQRLKVQRGRAKDHNCSCGSSAAQWAYQHGDPGERMGYANDGSPAPFSTNLDAYVPMCVSCHKKFDMARKR